MLCATLLYFPLDRSGNPTSLVSAEKSSTRAAFGATVVCTRREVDIHMHQHSMTEAYESESVS